jgi:hypothetical protein
VTKVVDHWVNVEGIRSIEYLGIWNEPNGSWAYQPRPIGPNVPGSYIAGMNRLYAKVWWYNTFARELPGVELVGADISPLRATNPMTDIGAMLESWQGGRRVDEYIDAVSFHSYVDDYGTLARRVREQIHSHNHDGQIERMLVGEVGSNDSTFDKWTKAGRAAHSLHAARKIIGYAKQGAYAVLRWWYNGDIEYGATDAAGKTRIAQTFNPVRLFATTLPKARRDAYVLKTAVSSTNRSGADFFDAVALSFWDAAAGRNKLAIWLVNQSLGGARDIRVQLNGIGSQRRFRKKLFVASHHLGYASTIADYGSVATLTPGNTAFHDRLWGQVIQVYVEQ